MPSYPFHLTETEIVQVRLKWAQLNDHHSRAKLPQGFFIDHDTSPHCRTYGYAYEIFLAGAHEKGIAKFICGGDRVGAALARLEQCRAPRD